MSSPARRFALPMLVATALLVAPAAPLGPLAGTDAGVTAGDVPVEDSAAVAGTNATADARSGTDRAATEADDRSSAVERGPRAAGEPARTGGSDADRLVPDPDFRRSDGRTASADGIRVDHDVRRVPDEPGVVEVRAVAHLPDSVTRFEVTPPEGVEVLETTGLEEGGEEEAYSWDESTANPSVTYRVEVNRTDDFETYDSVDVGQWALVDHSLVDVSFHYWFEGEDPGYEEVVTVAPDGTGYAGDEITYLGDHEVREETGDPTVRFVVAGATEMAADRETAAATLRHAAGSFDVARAPDPVTVFVVPEPLGNGLKPGGTLSEFFVRGDVAVSGPESTWTHEYVHTRQLYLPTESMAWLDEATAEYYGALLSMQAGTTPYRSFRREVTNERYADADLTAPTNWPDSSVEYDEGARVVAALDVRIREETDGEKTFMDVFERISEFEDDPTRAELELTYARFKRAIRDVTGTRLGAYVDAIVTGDGGAEVPVDPHRYTTGPTTDADGDNLTAAREREAGTNPFVADTDSDGLDDARELELGTNATLADTDEDGLNDGREVELGTDPLAADTDGDDLADGRESTFGTDPTVADTDGDGLDDGRERELGTDPTAADTDEDGLDDAREVELGTDPAAADTDGDGLDDAREVELGTDPTTADTDEDGLDDAREVALGTDPTVRDTDGDGLADGVEVTEYDTDPTAVDTDEDGLDDGAELEYDTDPTVADTDGDGRTDGREVELGSDPTTADVGDGTATGRDSGGAGGSDSGGDATSGDGGDGAATDAGDASTDATGPTPLASLLALLAIVAVCGAIFRFVRRD